MLYLVLSLLILIPLNIKLVVAADETVTNQKAVSICGGGLDIDESLFLSAFSLCLPGILKKGMEFKELTCQEVKCKYDAVMQGRVNGENKKGSYKQCSLEYNYRVCKYVLGELFALPIFNFVDFLRNILKNLLANPLGVAYGVAVYYARKQVTGCLKKQKCSSYPMRAYAILLTITDILAVTQQLKMMAEAGDMFDFNKDSACDDMGDIRDEMQEIIDATSSSSSSSSSDDVSNLL